MQSRSRSAGEHFYLDALAMLVLDEDMHRALFAAAPGLYAIYLDVTDDAWKRTLERRFLMLQGKYQSWIGIALGHYRQALMDEGADYN